MEILAPLFRSGRKLLARFAAASSGRRQDERERENSGSLRPTFVLFQLRAGRPTGWPVAQWSHLGRPKRAALLQRGRLQNCARPPARSPAEQWPKCARRILFCGAGAQVAPLTACRLLPRHAHSGPRSLGAKVRFAGRFCSLGRTVTVRLAGGRAGEPIVGRPGGALGSTGFESGKLVTMESSLVRV